MLMSLLGLRSMGECQSHSRPATCKARSTISTVIKSDLMPLIAPAQQLPYDTRPVRKRRRLRVPIRAEWPSWIGPRTRARVPPWRGQPGALKAHSAERSRKASPTRYLRRQYSTMVQLWVAAAVLALGSAHTALALSAHSPQDLFAYPQYRVALSNEVLLNQTATAQLSKVSLPVD